MTGKPVAAASPATAGAKPGSSSGPQTMTPRRAAATRPASSERAPSAMDLAPVTART